MYKKKFIISFSFRGVFEERKRPLTNLLRIQSSLFRMFLLQQNEQLDSVPVSLPLKLPQRFNRARERSGHTFTRIVVHM